MKKSTLILGDALALLLVTIIGFVAHGGTGASYLPRFAAAYFPLAAAWFLLAPWFGLFDESIHRNARQLWRPALTVLFAAPLAAVLRGLLLGESIQPVFVIVFGFANALGMTAWRGIWLAVRKTQRIVKP